MIPNHDKFIVTKARVQDATELCIANIYGPNCDSPEFYKNIYNIIRRLVGEEDLQIIIAGDFNLTLNQEIDNFNYRRENNTRARDTARNIMYEHDLIDMYRERNRELFLRNMNCIRINKNSDPHNVTVSGYQN